MTRADHDLIIIGAGAAGLIAARFAARLGARVLLVERDRIGGDCTWTGCVPSKSLIRVAKAAHEVRTASRFGVMASTPRIDMERAMAYVQQNVQSIYAPTSPEALQREGIRVAIGPASFEDAHTVRVGVDVFVGRRILICTGATPVVPDLSGLAETPYLTYHTVFSLQRLPSSLAIVGGGPLGVELGQAFQRLGSRVTVIAPRLLPYDDPEATTVLARVLAREGLTWVQGRATSVRAESHGVVVASEAGDTMGDAVLIATGRQPNLEGLTLERAGVTYSSRGIPVDDRLRTNIDHIYAAGDVIGGEQFSHVAGWQAFEATRNALLPGSASGRANPMAWVTFTDPEIAQVGLTEATARARFGRAAQIARWDIAQVDRAKCDNDEDGFIKLMTDGKGRLVGATIVASRAGEMSGEMSLAIARGLTMGELSSAVHAYPTYTTALQQMASQVATARWTTSTTGRLLARWLGFASNSPRA